MAMASHKDLEGGSGDNADWGCPEGGAQEEPSPSMAHRAAFPGTGEPRSNNAVWRLHNRAPTTPQLQLGARALRNPERAVSLVTSEGQAEIHQRAWGL